MEKAKIENFVNDLADVFDVSKTELNSEYGLPKADEWESVALISVIALVDEHFDVTLRADDLNQMKVLADIYTFIEKHG